MAVVTVWFGAAFRDKEANVSNAPWLFLTDTIKCSLHTVTYAPDVDANKFWSSATNEVSSANYTTGGFTLTTKTITYDTASNETRYDADDEVWTTVTFTARHAIFYKSTGTAGTSPLIWWVDFGADQTVSGGNFSIVNSATGDREGHFLMAKVYKVTYTRLPKSKSKVESNVYSEGHYREISMVADSEEEAKEIAEKRLAKQFPDRVVAPETESKWDEKAQDWVEVETGGEVVLNEGSLINGEHDPALAQSNYKLQGVEVVG